MFIFRFSAVFTFRLSLGLFLPLLHQHLQINAIHRVNLVAHAGYGAHLPALRAPKARYCNFIMLIYIIDCPGAWRECGNELAVLYKLDFYALYKARVGLLLLKGFLFYHNALCLWGAFKRVVFLLKAQLFAFPRLLEPALALAFACNVPS